jgi:hypothetical protein
MVGRSVSEPAILELCLSSPEYSTHHIIPRRRLQIILLYYYKIQQSKNRSIHCQWRWIRRSVGVSYVRLLFDLSTTDLAWRGSSMLGAAEVGAWKSRENEKSEIRQIHFSALYEKVSGEAFGAYCWHILECKWGPIPIRHERSRPEPISTFPIYILYTRYLHV